MTLAQKFKAFIEDLNTSLFHDEDIYNWAKTYDSIGYAYFQDKVCTYQFADNSLMTAEYKRHKWVFTIVDGDGNPIEEREELPFLV